jgi:hypothetical protein
LLQQALHRGENPVLRRQPPHHPLPRTGRYPLALLLKRRFDTTAAEKQTRDAFNKEFGLE